MPSFPEFWVDPDTGIGSRDGLTRATAWANLNAGLSGIKAAHANLTTDDVFPILNCVNENNTLDSVAITETPPAGMSDTHGIWLRTPIAYRSALPGGWSTAQYRYSRAQSAAALNLNAFTRHLILEGLLIENTNAGGSDEVGLSAEPVANGRVLVDGVYVRGLSTTVANAGIYVTANTNNHLVRVRNSVIRGFAGSSLGFGIYGGASGGSGMAHIYDSNTIVGPRVGIVLNDTLGTRIARNNLIDSTGTPIGTAFGTATNNATTRSSLGTGTGRVSQTFAFEDAAAGDFRLTLADTGALGFGLNLSADSDNPFALDFASIVRGSVWDIGAHQKTMDAIDAAILRRYRREQLLMVE